MRFIKTYQKTLIFFIIIGLFGGFFTGLYLLDSYPDEIAKQLEEQVIASGLGNIPTNILLGAITAIQSALYGLVLGAIGIWLGKKTGLWKDERDIRACPLFITLLLSVICGLAMILPDILFFGKYSEAIMESYLTKPTIPYILATISYGAVIEEVMLRLFMMSLIAFILFKLFGKNHSEPTVAILAMANIICSLLFALGHLPATFAMLGSSPIIIFRCILMNGSLGLVFGWLYRKYGLRYAMIAHGGCHIVSKLIWLLFI